MNRPLAVGTACALAVVLCVPALLLRVSAEQRQGTVEIAVVHSAIAAAPGRPRGTDSATLERLRRSGVAAVVLGMESVRGLVAHGDVARVDVGAAPPGTLPPKMAAPNVAATVLHCPRGDPGGQCARIAAAARARYGADRVTTATVPSASAGRGARYVRIDGVRDLADMPVGYNPTRLRELRASGMRVVLALPARLVSGRRWLESEVRRAAALTGAQTVFALGPLPFLSSAADRTAFADFLAARHLDLALPDLTAVPGADVYGRRLQGHVVRSHLMDVGPHSDRRGLVVRSRRAQKERGVRLVVLRAGSSAAEGIAATISAIAGLAPELTSDLPGGLRRGAPSAQPAVRPGVLADAGAILAALLVVGCAAGVIAGVPVRRDVPVRRQQRGRSAGRWRALGRRTVDLALSPQAVLGGLGAVAIVGAGALATSLSILWQALALVVALAGASLAVLVPCRAGPSAGPPPAADGADWRIRRGTRHGIGRDVGRLVTSYGLCVGIATATGLVVAALGSRSEFLVGLVPFAGVKLLLLTPPVVVAIGTGVAGRSARRQAAALWRVRSRRPAYVLLGVLVVAVVAYYVIRSGNSGVAPGFELRVRDALDETLYVRPRFKEALLGFPALCLALAYRPAALARRVLAVVAAVGTASLVDTFAHFHTPVYVALLRSAYAAVIGLLVGLAVLLVVRLRPRRLVPHGARRLAPVESRPPRHDRVQTP